MTTIPKGYKRTEIGILPENWEVVRLGEVTECLDHKRIPLNESQRARCEKIFPYYGASGMIDYVDDYIFDEKLVLLGEDGANIIDRSTRLAFCVEGKIWVNNHAHVLRPKGINQYFLAEILEILKYDKYNTGTAQPKLKQEIVSRIQIPLPPLAEQEKIAEILSTWDTQIQNLQSLITEKKNLKKGLYQALLSAKIRLAGFNEAWEVVQLGEVAKIYQPQTIKQTNFSKEGFLVYGANGVIGKYHSFNHEKEQIAIACRGNTCGSVHFTKPYSWITGNAMVINLDNSKQLNKFYAYQKLAMDNFDYLITGSGQPQITSDIKNHKIPLPPLAEQEKIAEILSEADREILFLEQKLESLKSQKKGLMQKLLSGKVRSEV
ncbi:hypothetical protein BBW65_00635 [Helicobacter enhydrae]|uniref:Type I restriction modification DNA specificity domain-containing protein n=1 Tax=Helicobacter enhydrae TaxID=222136 RepID=A0A1B1U3S4_9HELI|nr:restriction endonuclease subunit S [Helicobacter enhydrae]ANV97413.1 hypothetical protein BBW65_00635 [Helicobacter enhydrae]